MLFGQEHVKRYLETDGAEGHEWQGTTVLILTTTGRRSGDQRSTPLIYQRHGDDYLVVASKSGDPNAAITYNLRDGASGQAEIAVGAPDMDGHLGASRNSEEAREAVNHRRRGQDLGSKVGELLDEVGRGRQIAVLLGLVP